MSELLTRTRAVMRLKHYSYKTEKIYVYWMKKYFHFHNLKHPKELSAAEVEKFLTFLAVEQKVSASTQNQALAAILFLYREVLQINLPWLEKFTPAKKSNHLPVVLTREEVNLILSELKGTNWIIANLLYGSGLRLTEALRLRVKDLDFAYQQIIVRDGKGKDRATVLPKKLVEPLKRQLTVAQKIHERDLALGFGRVKMPFALERKYPNAERE
jgi:integron integrase